MAGMQRVLAIFVCRLGLSLLGDKQCDWIDDGRDAARPGHFRLCRIAALKGQ